MSKALTTVRRYTNIHWIVITDLAIIVNGTIYATMRYVTAVGGEQKSIAKHNRIDRMTT